jgi:hypothetical protein
LASILHRGCFRVSLVVILTCTVLAALRCLRGMRDHISELTLHESLMTCWSLRGLKFNNTIALSSDSFCRELTVILEWVEPLILSRKYHMLDRVIPHNYLLLLVHRDTVWDFLMLIPYAFELVSDVLVVWLILVREPHQVVINILDFD